MLTNSGCSRRAWTRGKYNLMIRGLSMVDWESELSGISVERQYNKFLNSVYPVIDFYVPLLYDINNSVSWKVNPPRLVACCLSSSWGPLHRGPSLEDSHFRECTVPRVGDLMLGPAWRGCRLTLSVCEAWLQRCDPRYAQ